MRGATRSFIVLSGVLAAGLAASGRQGTAPLALPGTGSGGAGGRGATKAAIGRPVDVLQMPDGSILISDDRGNRLIRVSYRR